jgi:hypothetical protein
MPINKHMTSQTGQSDYARHMRDQRGRQRQWSPSHKSGRGGGNRK